MIDPRKQENNDVKASAIKINDKRGRNMNDASNSNRKQSDKEKREDRRFYIICSVIALSVLIVSAWFIVPPVTGFWDELTEKEGQFVKVKEAEDQVFHDKTLEFINQEGYVREHSEFDVKVDETLDTPKVTYTQVHRFGKDRSIKNVTILFPSAKYLDELEIKTKR